MNILAFFAHPDDETMLAGGTMALLAKCGAQVHYLCATRGEGGETGEPPICTRSELGDVRQQEMECAVRALGGASLAFLDYIDPTVSVDGTLYAYTDDLDTLALKVQERVISVQADAVFTHGINGEYGHPAHILTHQATCRAIENLAGSAPVLYSIAASFEGNPKPRIANQDQPAHLILDLKAVMGIKEAAAMCHRSQHALFVRRASKAAGRKLTVPQVLIDQEGIHRTHPEFDQGDYDAIFEMLAPWALTLQAARY